MSTAIGGVPQKIPLAGLVPAIHVFLRPRKTWMAGSSPAMTKLEGTKTEALRPGAEPGAAKSG